MRLVIWGTYDTGKPRVRILLRGLRESGVEIIECHADVWGGVDDKSRVSGATTILRRGLRWLCSYPSLVWRYLRQRRHDAVLVGYMGQLDVLVLWPLAKLRGVPIVWDAFLSLYGTVVEDRRMVGPRHPLALVLLGWEWLACRAANLVLLDTRAHAEYFIERFRVVPEKVRAVFVGVEPEVFPGAVDGAETRAKDSTLTVLFYGQFIPLHGIETIIRAARLLEREPVRWVLIGRGQEAPKIAGMLADHPLPKLQWIPWVPYTKLSQWIDQADVCLGIFGDSDKAGRVIPNKVFQILAAGKPLITRDSAAIRELLDPDMPGVTLVPAANPETLAAALAAELSRPREMPAMDLHEAVRDRIQPVSIGRELIEHIEAVL